MYGKIPAGPALAMTGLPAIAWHAVAGVTIIAVGIALTVFAPRLGRHKGRRRA
jgi:hypothetical protein